MGRRIALLAALAALMAPGVASAAQEPPTPQGGWGAADLQVAAAYWGVTAPPNCAATNVEFDVELAPGLVGWATEPEEPGEDCLMRIATGRVTGGLYWQCVTVVHEFGHWMGLGHSADTSSPMAAELNPTIYVRGCALLTRERRSSVTKITHKNFRLR
jgi:hypothetical protein